MELRVLLNTLFVLGAVGGIINNKFGYIPVAIAGGIAGSLGLILSSLATDVFHLYMAFGVLAGKLTTDGFNLVLSYWFNYNKDFITVQH